MANYKQDDIALSYFDSLLRESDLSLLHGANWINDKIIGFYFEYLEQEVFREFKDCVCFITPDVTQFIKLYEGPELSMFLEPLNLETKDMVLLAVNNNASSDHSGGSHWSLLVYLRKENIFQYLDSSNPMNLLPSQQCAHKITPFLKVSSVPPVCKVPSCPQQSNSYDCGVYVLLFAKAMCSIHLQNCSPQETLHSVTSASCVQFRVMCLELIKKLPTAM